MSSAILFSFLLNVSNIKKADRKIVFSQAIYSWGRQEKRFFHVNNILDEKVCFLSCWAETFKDSSTDIVMDPYMASFCSRCSSLLKKNRFSYGRKVFRLVFNRLNLSSWPRTTMSIWTDETRNFFSSKVNNDQVYGF